jgi:long-subunit acyl-CoA synthetase (AMP-forming)
MTTPYTNPELDQLLFDSAVHHAAMRAHYLRQATACPGQRRSHLHAARRHEWCVVDLAVKAEVQAVRLFDMSQQAGVSA